jgi:nucleoside 2-deoxyribosyltransferase
MKIAICGSMKVFAQMKELGKSLNALDHNVFMPNSEGTKVDYSKLPFEEQVRLKSGFIKSYLEKIKECDAIMIANFDQENKLNYIGSNTFVEMAFAFALGKKIYIWQELPEQENKLEIAGMLPVALGGKLNEISKIYLSS